MIYEPGIYNFRVKYQSEDGEMTVTYFPRQIINPEDVTDAIKELKERFSSDSSDGTVDVTIRVIPPEELIYDY